MTRHDHGFTLVEIVVVVSILAAVAALSVPAVAAIQARTADTSTRTTLNQVRTELGDYLASVNNRPPGGGLAICIQPSQVNTWLNATDVNEFANLADPCPPGEWMAWTIDDTIADPSTAVASGTGLPDTVTVRGYVATDGAFCLDAANSTSTSGYLHLDSRRSRISPPGDVAVDISTQAIDDPCTAGGAQWQLRVNAAGDPAAIPGAATGLLTDVGGAHTVTATWTAPASPPNPNSYRVTLSGPAGTLTSNVTGTTWTLDDTLTPGLYNLTVTPKGNGATLGPSTGTVITIP